MMIKLISYLGYSNLQWAHYLEQRSRSEAFVGKPLLEEPPVKVFKQKHPRLPVLNNYNSVLPESYWQKWLRKDYGSLTPAVSWIQPEALEGEARRLGFEDKEGRLQRTLTRLREGASIGCKGSARLSTKVRNSPTAFQYGARVMDSIQGWVADGLCYGPLKPEEMPFEDYTINPIVVKIKPTGAARVCINMSAPYPKPWHKEDEPSAVNSGVNKEEFPAFMGSTRSFSISLIKAGCPAEMIKMDWNQGT